MTVGRFCTIISRLCIKHCGSVTSWVRSRARNERVGGHPASRHMNGLAVDIVCDTMEGRNALFKEAYQYGLHGYKRRGGYGRACHIQDRRGVAP